MVARYLCRRLIDAHSPSKEFFLREMYLYSKSKALIFNGTVKELENEFKVDYKERKVKIYDKDGKDNNNHYIIK